LSDRIWKSPGIGWKKHEDGSVDIIAIIENTGVVPVNNVKVLYKAEGEELAIIEVPSVLPGEKAEASHTLSASAGFAKVKLEIDPGDEIGETRESDNWTFALLDYELTLYDVVAALKVAAGMNSDTVSLNADVNGDARIGLEEAIRALQIVAGLRD